MIFYDKDPDYSRIKPIDCDYVEGVLKMVYQRHLDKTDHYAHFIEHELFVDVLKSIASSKVKDPAKMATLALRTLNMPFARDYEEKK